MTYRVLSTCESEELRKKVCEEWAWSGHYFYPLQTTSRTDVLAFEGNLLEQILTESAFKALLLTCGISSINWWREIDASEETTVEKFPFFFGHSESFIVDRTLQWLVYWSHEETITFCGEHLISSLKHLVPEWETAKCTWGVATS